MSQASELLNSVTESAAGTATEGNIVIGRDRYIVVPDSLKKIGVQYDHDVETVTFDCPRYWDNWDLSTMRIYINYMRADGGLGMHLCTNVTVDASNSELVHFDWTISGHVTEVAGQLSFLVCIKNVEIDGIEKTHWNSELNTEMYISAGLKCKETILRKYPDIISQLLLRMETAETNLKDWIAKTEDKIADWEANLKKDINTWETNTYKKMDDRMKTAESNTTPAEILRRINSALDTNAETQQQIYDAASDYLRDGIVATGKIEKETNAYLEENLAIIADDLLDITLEKTIEKSGVVIPSGEGNMLPVKIMGDSYQNQYSGKNTLDCSGLSTYVDRGVTFTPVYKDNGELEYVLANGTNDGTGESYFAISGKPSSLKDNQSLGEVVLSGCPSGGGASIYRIVAYAYPNGTSDAQKTLADYGNGTDSNSKKDWSTVDKYYSAIFVSRGVTVNNLKFYPMLKLVSIEDDTYEPYCGGVPSPNPEFPQEIENVGVVRNLLDCSGLVEHTINGVTFTPVYDENGLLEYFEANGTANANAAYALNLDVGHFQHVFLSGTTGDSSIGYLFVSLYDNGTWKSDLIDKGSGITISNDTKYQLRAYVRVLSGQTANKLKFYPMIRPASIADPTYHPYIPENKENLLGYPYANSTKTENGVTFTDNGDGSIKFVGTSTGYSTFTLNTDWKPVPGNYKKNVGKKCDFKISRYKRSSNSYDAIVVENNITVFDTSDWDFETYIYRPLIQISSSLGAVDDTFYPRIVKNHIPAQGSQYAVEVKSVGKNLLENNVKSSTSNGLTYTNENEKLHLSGTTTALTNLFSAYENFVLKKGIYTLGCEIGGNVSGNLMLYSKSNAVLAICSVSVPKQFEITEDTAIDRFVLQIQSGVTLNGNLGVILNRGTELLPFEPYQSHSTTIHLDEPLRGIGEYRDTICQKDGVWGVERVIGEEVFDGSDDEKWNVSLAKDGISYRIVTDVSVGILEPIGIRELPNILCDTFVVETALNTYNGMQGFSVHDNGGIRIYDTTFNTSDVSLWKTHLAENPMTVEYQLTTPTFTPFEDQKQFWKFMAFDGATTISIIDGSDNTVPTGVFRVGRNQDGGKLLSHHATLNNMEDLEGKITPIPILQADYDKLPESKKKNGVYIITDANVTSFTGNTVRYTGGREGLGDTVDKAISTVDEKVEERLTASDGTKFRFGVNNEGEYGYIVTDSEGADTFFPFKDLERDTAATAAAAQITEGYTAWVNGKLIVGTRPAAPKTLSGEFYRGIGEGVATYKYQIDFSPAFDVIPEFTYNIQLGNNDTTGQLLYVKRDHAMFQIVHSKGNESSSVRITWTATVQ